MKLHEYQAKEIFASRQIPVQEGSLIETPDQLNQLKLPYPLVLKAQVLVGGRGKAGGVQLARDSEEAKKKASEIFQLQIKGVPVRKILAAAATEIQKEYYLSFVLDRGRERFAFMTSAEGGVEIEEVARKNPEKIFQRPVDPWRGFSPYEARLGGKAIGLEKGLLLQFAQIAERLYSVLRDYDAELAEINPLALTSSGLLAIDAKLILDDNALYRQKGFVQDEDLTPLEQRAKESGLAYVELEGNVAVIGCGAGLVMSSLDVLKALGAKPANFLDVGGGASTELMRKALSIVLAKKEVRSVFINIFGGITRCDEIARGIVEFAPQVPISVRMTGTHEEEGMRILRENGYSAFSSMEEAAFKAARLAEKGGTSRGNLN